MTTFDTSLKIFNTNQMKHYYVKPSAFIVTAEYNLATYASFK